MPLVILLSYLFFSSLLFSLLSRRSVILSDPGNPFDPSRMALGWRGLPGRPIPRHGPLDTFLRGPIPWPWWSRAASLPGRALHVASAVRYLGGWKGAPTVSLALGDL